MKKNTNVYGHLLLSGMLSSIVYILHVVIGGLLSDEYNHLIQPISDLTSSDAANRGLHIIFTSAYGILAIFFSYSLYYLMMGTENKLLNIGLMLFLIMQTVSFFGYLLFPLEVAGMEGNSFQSIMHIVVTIIVVLFTIGFTFVLGYSFVGSRDLRKLGVFILACGVIIILSGAGTGIVMANEIPIAGLVERINIFTLQIMVFVISFVSFRRYKEKGSLDFS